jgi:hypothetical protein
MPGRLEADSWNGEMSGHWILRDQGRSVRERCHGGGTPRRSQRWAGDLEYLDSSALQGMRAQRVTAQCRNSQIQHMG